MPGLYFLRPPLVVLGLIVFATQVWAQGQADEAATQDQISGWIQKLGHAKFRERERAVNQLRSLGTAAFYPLLASRDAGDAEVRGRVRRLIDELRPTMLRQGVPRCEMAYVREYPSLSDEQRRIRIRTLAQLTPEFGCIPLLRIASTEEDLHLAKAAAAGLLWHAVPADPVIQRQIKEQLGHSVGPQPPLPWIQELVKSLGDPRGSIEAFDAWASAEQAAWHTTPHSTDETDVLGPLQRYTVDLRMRASLKSEATVRAKTLFAEAAEESDRRLELVAWLYRAQYYEVLLRLAEDQRDWFSRHRYQHYLAASAAVAMSENDRGNKLADAAFAAATLDSDRLQVARQLRQSGINDWAEREFRAVCQREETFVLSEDSLEAIWELADMYHQQQRHRDCCELLDEVCRQLESTPPPGEMSPLLGYFDVESTRMRVAYEQGLQALRDDDLPRAKDRFRLALPYAQRDNDVLCDAYKLEEPDLRAQVELRKQAIVKQHLQSMVQYERALVQPRDIRSQQVIRQQVARDCNELAWILINTGEDVETALRYAQRSVDLDPGLAYSLDTLAVCHFKRGNVPLAIACERQALRLMPHREDLQRTLSGFYQSAQNSGLR